MIIHLTFSYPVRNIYLNNVDLPVQILSNCELVLLCQGTEMHAMNEHERVIQLPRLIIVVLSSWLRVEDAANSTMFCSFMSWAPARTFISKRTLTFSFCSSLLGNTFPFSSRTYTAPYSVSAGPMQPQRTAPTSFNTRTSTIAAAPA